MPSTKKKKWTLTCLVTDQFEFCCQNICSIRISQFQCVLFYYLVFLLVGCSMVNGQFFGPQPITSSPYQVPVVVNNPGEIGGSISVPVTLDRIGAPYFVREDVVIEETGELIIRPGVQLIFSPTVGITVFGRILAEGTDNERIVMRSSQDRPSPLDAGRLTTFHMDNDLHSTMQYTTITERSSLAKLQKKRALEGGFPSRSGEDDGPSVRLVEGLDPLTGRLQMYHRGSWRSVCSNSRNWTVVDMQTVCRELGYTGGEYWIWVDHLNDTRQMLWEKPKCLGLERRIKDCPNWNSRQLGAGVCDHHPNIGLRCEPYFKFPSKVQQNWRGLRFENAKHRETYAHENTLRIKESLSSLKYVDIFHAGVGRGYNTTSAIEILGVPPEMNSILIENSAYNGINISNPQSPTFKIENCTIRNNGGFGVYVNSSFRGFEISRSLIERNGNDGIRYVFHDILPEYGIYRPINGKDVFELCTVPITLNQIYPLRLLAEQFETSFQPKICSKRFTVRRGYVLTVHFPYMLTSSVDSGAELIIYDGPDSRGNLLWKTDTSIKVRNESFPQSVTSTRESIYIEFKAKALTKVLVFIDIVSGLGKDFDMKVSHSQIVGNNGRGVVIENLRSQLLIEESVIKENNHIAGVHVLGGAGFVNITRSEILSNIGDGVNISYSGGSPNISRSLVSGNTKRGIALWFNESSERLPSEQELIIEYSEISLNLEEGIFVGNFCGRSIVNISGNTFRESKKPSIEIESCWRRIILQPFGFLMKLMIGHNRFYENEDFGIKLIPLLNADALIEHNYFTKHKKGCLLIKGVDFKELETLASNVQVSNCIFEGNWGLFVASLGLNHFSPRQKLLFTQNFVRYNNILESYSNLHNPRSRVSAVIIVSSSNVDIYRNVIQNPESKYELGSHFEDQSFELNCTYNWLGANEEKGIYYRIFDRKDRFNLARISYIPFLLSPTDPNTEIVQTMPLFVPTFDNPERIIGGEITGIESLINGEYKVVRDISIRPGGKLQISYGVTLKFLPSVGLLVGGQFHAEGFGHADGSMVKFTLFETGRLNATDSDVRLVGGRTRKEGRLQVRVGNTWGSVCNYEFDILAASVACRQMGFVLNPHDWLLESFEIPQASPSEQIIMSKIKCNEWDHDIIKCDAERAEDIENSCSHDNLVGIRCYDTSWAGIRMAITSEKSVLKFALIEKAGLLDPHTNEHKPAVQMDFSHHVITDVRISDNTGDGLGIIYSDLYFPDNVNYVERSEFSRNLGNGVLLRQLGLHFRDCLFEQNKGAGIIHDSAILRQHQREIAGWVKVTKKENIEHLPFHYKDLWLTENSYKYLISQPRENVNEVYNIIAQDQNLVIGIQLLNPIHNESSEEIIIYDRPEVPAKTGYLYDPDLEIWQVGRDLVTFPTVSSSYGITLWFKTGSKPRGGTILLVRAIRAPDLRYSKSRILDGLPLPRLKIWDSKIRYNGRGIAAIHYNRHENEEGDIYLRAANESIEILRCELSFNQAEAFHVFTPFREIYRSNISEITFMVNQSVITDNGRVILQYSKDLRSSNNIYHWLFKDNVIERNKEGGFSVSLPYVWQYNENHTHSIHFQNITFRNNANFEIMIRGHFAKVDIFDSIFENNICKLGLFTLAGMEKEVVIFNNRFVANQAVYIVQWDTDSQSKILGSVSAYFVRNTVKYNRVNLIALHKQTARILNNSTYQPMSYAIGLKGLQRVNVTNNLFGDNQLDFELLAGIKTAKLENFVNVRKNWWGTADAKLIKFRIFDFDDWNSYAIAEFRPYLLQDNLDSPISLLFEPENDLTIDNLGGRLTRPLTLYNRNYPYVIKSDLTIMPNAMLTIAPGVEIEFYPSVGILALGPLIARGFPEQSIIMRPIRLDKKAQLDLNYGKSSKMEAEETRGVRLCAHEVCEPGVNQGFLEYFNKTTLQWIPMCDNRFTERNAQVICRQLGFDHLNVHLDYGRRLEYEYNLNVISRIRQWPEPIQCTGDESNINDCPIRMNGQLYGYEYPCHWNDDFIFIYCGDRNLEKDYEYWGGIRFASPDFEQHLFIERMHDAVTHGTNHKEESILEWVRIIGAGILHNELSPAVLSSTQSPFIRYVNITQSAHHGISIISSPRTMRMTRNHIMNNLGIGFTGLSITGEGQHSDSSSFFPLKRVELPYGVFGMLDICDTNKEIIVEERVIVYYKYDNYPVDCVKIFSSVYLSKNLGFRLIQMNLFNSSGKPWPPDYIKLIDGDVYNSTTEEIATISMDNDPSTLNKFYSTSWPSLSVILHATGATKYHGFIAEILTLPISPHGVDRNVQHNISYSVIDNNTQGAFYYGSAGEITPMVTLERNRFESNCLQFFGNFSSCEGAIQFDVQNMQNIYFMNNVVRRNQGGLHIMSDSSGTATSLKGYVYNNVFENNTNREVLKVEGKRSSPFQEIIFYRNIVTRNDANFRDVVVLSQVVSNLSENYFHANRGEHIMEVTGFEKVRLPIYQSCTHNSFFMNEAIDYDDKSTIIAGSTGQQYVDNIFVNPANSYELATVNKSRPRALGYEFSSAVDARHNWWGWPDKIPVMGRIKDENDNIDLLRVLFLPYRTDNLTLLSGKCPPGYTLVGDTCYMYVGGFMNFSEAKDFCRAENASMPYVESNYYSIIHYLRSIQEDYDYYDRVWVQDVDQFGKCTVFVANRVELEECSYKLPFLCETDPKVKIDPLAWTTDSVTIGALVATFLALVLIVFFIIFWYTKSKQRESQRLERRNSIRASIRSSRSLTSMASLSEAGYRRRMAEIVSSKNSLNQNAANYAKFSARMNGNGNGHGHHGVHGGGRNGSFDSLEQKSTAHSLSAHSYDLYDTHTANTAVSTAPTSEFGDPQDGYSVHPNGLPPVPKSQYHTRNIRAEISTQRPNIQAPHPPQLQQHQSNLISPNNYSDLTFQNQNFRETPSIGSMNIPPGPGSNEYWHEYSSSSHLQNNGNSIKYKNNSSNNDFHRTATASTIPISSKSHQPDDSTESLETPHDLHPLVLQREVSLDPDPQQLSRSYDILQPQQYHYMDRNTETPTMSFKEIESRDIANANMMSKSQPNLQDQNQQQQQQSSNYPQVPSRLLGLGDQTSGYKFGDSRDFSRKITETSLDDLEHDYDLDETTRPISTYLETNLDNSHHQHPQSHHHEIGLPLPPIRPSKSQYIPTTTSSSIGGQGGSTSRGGQIDEERQLREDFKALSNRSKSVPLETEM